MSDAICLTGIPEECWRAAIAALAADGWSLRKGGGLDFSRAVLERDGMNIKMEYDIWSDGEMVFASVDTPKIRAALPAHLLADLPL
ncbi:hypothetical protein [Pararhizobium sp.]|uniref:hypothetical protein n=1 Tax=Pararhizobium sp. TaxID=1977563 RepID=UPI0027181B6B|nr:hypothetical protein [Pararhizobium sp.]MDO9416331.1 hypothetical protein [Pararhizobium sp.]